ncbi:hypothetical protein NQZ68_020001, partial [Dissostichus eleginoides]
LVQYFLWSPSPPDTRTAPPYADRTLRRSLCPRAKKLTSKVRRRLVRKERLTEGRMLALDREDRK